MLFLTVQILLLLELQILSKNELPLNDFNKRKAIKEKLGFDVDAAIKNNEASKEEVKSSETPTRRVVEKKEDAESKAPARRTTPKYNIVNKQQ